MSGGGKGRENEWREMRRKNEGKWGVSDVCLQGKRIELTWRCKKL